MRPKISAGCHRPDQKFVTDICYGAMASQTCLLSEIAHALYEDSKKVNVIERLTRHLNRGVSDRERSNYLNMTAQWLPEQPVIHIDDSDVVKPCGCKFEDLCMVRDGSESTGDKVVLKKGYHVTEATALTKTNHPVSITSTIWSSESKDFISANDHTNRAIDQCVQQFGKATFVMDRGYDDNKIFQKLEKMHQDYVIRLKLNRKVFVGGRWHTMSELCDSHKGKVCAKFRYHGKNREAKLSQIRCQITASRQTVSVILVYGLSDHPMALVTNRDIHSNLKSDKWPLNTIVFWRNLA